MKKVLLGLLTLVFSLSIYADHTPDHKGKSKREEQREENTQSRSAKTDYGMAGCGLGSLIFNDSPSAGSQILASTTNGTFGSATFGATFGTSNCDPKQAIIAIGAVTKHNTELFVAANFHQLQSDIAKQQGETIANLAFILGCKEAANLGTSLNQNFNHIYTDNKAQVVAGNILNVVENEASLAAQCNHI